MIAIKHSGNIGDIIYSLPAMRKAAQLHGQPIDVLLQTNVQAEYANNPNFNHPSGSVMLTKTGAEMLKPLLMNMPFINAVKIADKFQSCHYDFDRIRQIGLRYTGSISRWYFYAFPELTCDLSEPIKLSITPKKTTKYVLNRSARYHNPTFDYRALLPIEKDITFIGLEEEFEVIQRKLPNLQYMKVSNFAETAAIIIGSDYFIGNQSMSYAIAEITGHPRLLEVCPTAHNCIPMTPNGYDAINLHNLIQRIALIEKN